MTKVGVLPLSQEAVGFYQATSYHPFEGASIMHTHTHAHARTHARTRTRTLALSHVHLHSHRTVAVRFHALSALCLGLPIALFPHPPMTLLPMRLPSAVRHGKRS